MNYGSIYSVSFWGKVNAANSWGIIYPSNAAGSVFTADNNTISADSTIYKADATQL